MWCVSRRVVLRRCVGAVAAYALFFHTLLAGFIVTQTTAFGDVPPAWTQVLCISGGNGPGDASGGSGKPNFHVVHCTLCATDKSVGCMPMAVPAASTKVVGSVGPDISDLVVACSIANWGEARAPPRA
jgi:hypothetical protein